MPELPDIEANARALRDRALNRRIVRVALHDPERLRGSQPADLEAALGGFAIAGVSRHGKILFLQLTCGWQLAVHFGMTGRLDLLTKATTAPAHTRLRVDFADGGGLAFVDQRRLGWVELTDSPQHYLKAQDVGPDALDLSAEGFCNRIEGKRGQIKTALMDQSLIAGLGNVYADEVLFQAGIRPDRKVNGLSDAEVGRLYEAIQSALTTAADRGADPAGLPPHFLTPRRGGDRPACPTCGGALETVKVSGRTTYLCPACQN
jgi:formamidopyrimidine-DNA glycosylase